LANDALSGHKKSAWSAQIFIFVFFSVNSRYTVGIRSLGGLEKTYAWHPSELWTVWKEWQAQRESVRIV